MYDLSMAMLMSTRLVVTQFVYPDSPEEVAPAQVVARAPRRAKVRLALAASLESAARAIAPKAVTPKDYVGAR